MVNGVSQQMHQGIANSIDDGPIHLLPLRNLKYRILPSLVDQILTKRGKRSKTCFTGTIRSFMAAYCSSVVTRSSWPAAFSDSLF